MKKILLISLLFSCKLFSSPTFDIFAYALQNDLQQVAVNIFKTIDSKEQPQAQRAFARKYPGQNVATLATTGTSTTTTSVGQLPAELTAAMNAAAGNDTEKALAGFRFIMLSPTGSGRSVIDRLIAEGKRAEVELILMGKG